MYIFTITYNFNRTSLAKKYNTMEEAVKILRTCLDKAVNILKDGSGYEPSVLDWSESNVVLVHAEGYTKETEDRNYALENCTYYRIFEV